MGGGRLLLNLPGPTPRLFTIMGEALGHHVGAEAKEFVDRVFGLHDTAEIQTSSERRWLPRRLRSLRNKAATPPGAGGVSLEYVHSTPLADPMAQVEDEGRRLLERDVVAKAGVGAGSFLGVSAAHRTSDGPKVRATRSHLTFRIEQTWPGDEVRRCQVSRGDRWRSSW